MRTPRDANALLEQLPAWVADAAVVRDGANFLLAVTRETGQAPPAGGQFVLRVPGGRYLVETLDVETAVWISRESAAGEPLVAGLVCPGSSILVRIRRVD